MQWNVRELHPKREESRGGQKHGEVDTKNNGQREGRKDKMKVKQGYNVKKRETQTTVNSRRTRQIGEEKAEDKRVQVKRFSAQQTVEIENVREKKIEPSWHQKSV